MPFASTRQLQTCYGRRLSALAKGQRPKWDCDEFLRATPRNACLPTVKGKKGSCRPLRKGEKLISPFYRGSRGGLYFYAAGVKVYVPADARSFVERKYAGKIRAE
jgi:hypothetical protein